MNEDLEKALKVVVPKVRGLVIKAIFENNERYVFAIRCSNGSVPIIGSIPAVTKNNFEYKPYTMYDETGDLKFICKVKYTTEGATIDTHQDSSKSNP